VGSIPTASTISMTALWGLDQFQDSQGGFALVARLARPLTAALPPVSLDGSAWEGRQLPASRRQAGNLREGSDRA